MRADIETWALQRGILTAWTDAYQLIDAVQHDIERAIASNPGTGDWCRDLLNSFSYGKDLPPRPLTAMVVAARSRAQRLFLLSPQQTVSVLVPPTYQQTTRRELNELIVRAAGDRARRLPVPVRAAAARLGLIRYGRNGIGHVPGLGGQWELAGWIIGGEHLPYVPIVDPARLDACRDCQACVTACPTGALQPPGWTVSAERCLTAINEREGPFPDHLDPRIHHCLVGCIRCQVVCPQHGPLDMDDVTLELQNDELSQLLAADASSLSSSLIGKLDAVGLGGWDRTFSRNLRALLAAGPSPLWP